VGDLGGGDLGAAREGGYRVGGLGYRVGGLGRPHAPPEWCRGAAAGPRQPALAARIEVHFVCGCELASRFFSEAHTNEFFGVGKSTPEPAGPCAPPRPGRWVYEKGAGKAARAEGTAGD
jgi:hypothetical protein